MADPISSPSRARASAVSILWNTTIAAATVMIARKLISAGAARKSLQLRSKVVLITGGSRGLGLALGQALGKQGCRVALCARDSGEIEYAIKRLADQQIEAVPFPCDLTNETEIRSLIDRVLEHFGTIDILINNAGYIKVGPFDSFDELEYKRAMDLMFWAPVKLALAAIPHMQRRGSGQIVNITSVGGRVSIPHLLPYSCAKFALVGFSTGLSTEVKSKGVHVLTVVPGLMRTGSYLNAEFAGDAKHEFAWFALLGNSPGFSVAAAYAAESIRRAIERRKYLCTISLPAKFLVSAEAIAPETTRTMLASINRLLPSTTSSESTSGKSLNTQLGKLYQTLTALGRRAAADLNE